MSYSRKEFIKKSLILSTGVSLLSCETSLSSEPDNNPDPDLDDNPNPETGDTPTEKPKDILIIGAGLSGLVTAYELSLLGYNITILEARDRVGGRVKTIRSGFSDGNFAEAGASRIPPDHNHTLNYISKFGLELDHFYPREGNYAYLSGSTRTLQTPESFLQGRPWAGSVAHSEYRKLKNGSEKLPLAFAEKLDEKIKLNAAVKSVDQTGDKILIVTENGQRYSADSVICTVPLPVLNKIQFIPSLSDQKTNASNGGYDYAASSRLFVQFNSRFWESEEMNAWGNSNYPEEIWQPSWDRDTSSGIILSYLRYNRAEEFDSFSEEEKKTSVFSRWNNIFPNLESHLDKIITHSWNEEKYSGGAWASPTSSQNSALINHIGKTEGRIYFAGEHISNYHGWMQGALASGLAVVEKIKSL